MRSSLFNKWMMNPYMGHGKDSKSFYVNALTNLNTHTRLVVDASASGALLSKTYNEAYEII
ncbi:hypothetical protein EPI10_023688 [Gossypium australe]|uniref:Uncharacterized protein n=1 Tax=Gossypium australe TaxID=47621 RepID=A0A5B6VWD1_9ROSI|nr:hypothetical protein EPI10_023688 [Gossypium australe]